MQFTLCGPDFNIAEFCFREENLTEEELTQVEADIVALNNRPPTFETDPQTVFDIPSMWQNYMDQLNRVTPQSPDDLVMNFALPAIVDFENDESTLTISIET